MNTLAISGPDASALLQALNDADETAWVLSARRANDQHLLLGRTLHDVPSQSYLTRGPRRLEIASSGYVPAFSHALSDGGVPAFIHTHPGSDPRPSRHDDDVDRQLSAHAAARGMPAYASLILGGTPTAPRFTGRVHLTGTDSQPVDRLRIAGRDMRLLLADAHHQAATAPIFDRQVRAFGTAGQGLLRALRVGVVGAGGTGSAVIEQLARLGVGELVIFDDDTIDETNLTRIHGATVADVGRAKAELAADLADRFGTDTRTTPIVGNATELQSIRALSACDVIFGCTDDHAGRLVLSRLAYRYLIPVIDCGVVVDVDESHVRGVFGRVSVMAPGEPCLVCRGQVDPSQASEQMMNPERRQELAGEGYARGAEGAAPAVVAFTTATAALSVNEMLARLLGYANSTATQLLLRFHDQAITRGGRPAASGHHCVTPSEWGLGDTNPVLGMVGLR